MALKFDRKEAIGNIKRALGHPVVHLELQDLQWDDALDAALRTFSTHIPRIRYHSIQVTTLEKHYLLPEDKVGEGLIDCMPPTGAQHSHIIVGGDVTLGHILHTYSLGEIALMSVYWDTVKDLLGAPFDWEYRHDTRDLFVTGLSSNGSLVYKYMEVWDAESLPQRYWDWIFDYGVAVAKGILGEIREKMGDLPGPGGQSISMNGTALKSEAGDAMSDLKENLRERIGDRHLIPIVAPTFF